MSIDVTVIYSFLIVVIAALFLRRALFEPVGRLLDERAAKIKGDAAERTRSLATREERIAQYQGRILMAKKAAWELHEGLRKEVTEERGRLLAGALAEAGEATQRGRAEVRGAAESAREQLASESERLAVEIASQILGRRVGSAAS